MIILMTLNRYRHRQYGAEQQQLRKIVESEVDGRERKQGIGGK
jgi:hypothetical protein